MEKETLKKANQLSREIQLYTESLKSLDMIDENTPIEKIDRDKYSYLMFRVRDLFPISAVLPRELNQFFVDILKPEIIKAKEKAEKEFNELR